MTRRAALFDMDRTLLRVDSALLYTRYQRREGGATMMDSIRVGYWMAQYTLGIIDAPRVARKALEKFAGKPEAWLEETCAKWFPEYVLPEVQVAGRQAVKKHHEAGDFVAIVTGATRYVASHVARELGIEHVVCTELEVDANGNFTGQPIEPLCYGPGKIELSRRLSQTAGFDLEDSVFYSDSITDLPLLELVREPIVVNPDRRLRRVAEARNWPIQRW